MTPAAFFSASFRDGWDIYLTLLRLTLPLLIIIRLLDEHFNLITHLGDILAPMMQLVGLPGSAGIVFATATLLQVYASILVLVTLWHELALNTAQLTVLMTMILIAHSLPVELRIAQKAGVSPGYLLLLRLGSAFTLGIILYLLYGDTYLQTEATLPFAVESENNWSGWALTQLKNWTLIFIIVQVVVLFVHFIRVTHLERLLIQLLMPCLRFLGIGEKTVTMVVVGMLLGLSYGGGLIIKESRHKQMNKRDVFCTLALLSLCHAIVEDTLLMLFLGAHISGVLFARVIFSLLVMVLLNLLLPRLSTDH